MSQLVWERARRAINRSGEGTQVLIDGLIYGSGESSGGGGSGSSGLQYAPLETIPSEEISGGIDVGAWRSTPRWE